MAFVKHSGVPAGYRVAWFGSCSVLNVDRTKQTAIDWAKEKRLPIAKLGTFAYPESVGVLAQVSERQPNDYGRGLVQRQLDQVRKQKMCLVAVVVPDVDE